MARGKVHLALGAQAALSAHLEGGYLGLIHCWMAETNTALKSNHLPMKAKVFTKAAQWMDRAKLPASLLAKAWTGDRRGGAAAGRPAGPTGTCRSW